MTISEFRSERFLPESLEGVRGYLKCAFARMFNLVEACQQLPWPAEIAQSTSPQVQRWVKLHAEMWLQIENLLEITHDERMKFLESFLNPSAPMGYTEPTSVSEVPPAMRRNENKPVLSNGMPTRALELRPGPFDEQPLRPSLENARARLQRSAQEASHRLPAEMLNAVTAQLNRFLDEMDRWDNYDSKNIEMPNRDDYFEFPRYMRMYDELKAEKVAEEGMTGPTEAVRALKASIDRLQHYEESTGAHRETK